VNTFSATLGVALSAALLTAQPAFADECTRPTDPGGAGSYEYGAATVNSFGNAHVLVWYATDGPHAVKLESSRSDGVPDDVVKVADVTGDALTRYTAMGFRPPLTDELSPDCGSNGGDARLDVYLVSMRGADGTTVVESGRCASTSPAQCASYILAKSDYAESYATAEIGIRTVLPHETFHAVQNAYDAELDRFWAEGSAQWATKALYPALTDLERNLPAFFSQSARSLDAPPGGVTAGFLYGSAIWPVFLSQRHGEAIVRSILETEAERGTSALVATDAVLQTMQSSLAEEFPRFAAWNAATGARTGTGGYLNALDYPEVGVTELAGDRAQAITSGLASFYYHARRETPVLVELDTDPSRNRGLLLPFVNGLPQVDRATPLPAELLGEGIVVVSGITTSKKDAPFALTLSTAPTPSGDSSEASGGCALAGPPRSRQLPASCALLFALCVAARFRARRRSCARAAKAADRTSP